MLRALHNGMNLSIHNVINTWKIKLTYFGFDEI
jgi:hypothetical protein